MSKLYYKYGCMGCGKTAMALMCKYNYEQKGYIVLICKSSLDDRDMENNEIIIKTRLGLTSKCKTFSKKDNLFEKYNKLEQKPDVLIVDECQFCTEAQVNQLKEISRQIPVICYGLKNNYKTYLFEGSKRLLEIADSIMEIKSVCRCGAKATINARFKNNQLVTDGREIEIGGNDCYEGLCYNCYNKIKNNITDKN